MAVSENNFNDVVRIVSSDTLHRESHHRKQFEDRTIEIALGVLSKGCSLLPNERPMKCKGGFLITKSSHSLSTDEWNKGRIQMQEKYEDPEADEESEIKVEFLTRQTIWYRTDKGKVFELSKEKMDNEWVFSYKEDGVQKPNRNFLPQAQWLLKLPEKLFQGL